MRLKITHCTRYEYANEVSLTPHMLRLRPRSTSHQRVERFRLTVTPQPEHMMILDSIDDSLFHRLYFQYKTKLLAIETEAIVVAKESLVPDDLHLFTNPILPVMYNTQIQGGLSPYLAVIPDSDAVMGWCQELVGKTGGRIDRFLMALVREIQQTYHTEYREFGWPHSPNVTMQRQAGSCRDLAWLMVACCRAMGIAARFVSGYVYDHTRLKSGGELHAWVEVYLLGYGWIGYDPSYACQVGERHIKICSGWVPELCATVEGSFIGQSSSTLDTRVSIAPYPEVVHASGPVIHQTRGY